jgi:hypothetical protein
MQAGTQQCRILGVNQALDIANRIPGDIEMMFHTRAKESSVHACMCPRSTRKALGLAGHGLQQMFTDTLRDF